jgi:hypothetical protein
MFVCGCRTLLGIDDVVVTEPSDALDGAEDPISDADPLACPPDYIPTGPSRYRMVTAGANWLTAQADCRDDATGTHLAIPETAAERQVLADMVSGASRWLGVTDRITEGTFLPIIGGTIWSPNWIGGGPGIYDCVLLTRTDGFDEVVPCDSTDPQWGRPYFCECDGKPVDPTTF